MRVVIQSNSSTVGTWAARHIAGAIQEAASRNSRFVLGLATGSTPLTTYAELIRMHREEGLSFAHVITFNMDEYVGLPKEHPESYHSFMWNNFFSHIDILPENTNILNGNAADLLQECADYERRITDVGGIDLFLAGIGVDGHLAFNEPFSSLTSRTRVMDLTIDTRIVNSRFFDGDVNAVPKQALTVGVGTVCDARQVILLATGYVKANALKHTIEGDVSHVWTASALQMHPDPIIVCDEQACMDLKVSTYRYFKEEEAGSNQ
ncbi:MAG: glucosamine-6-phosphate deaminase [Proteiniphilum sp.]|jgi:glucosamine-6-phosphate deaminase|nr:glucosamine-6-phosphate deaminase [Proteiniphilum sp.]